jgi:hypothetical protein
MAINRDDIQAEVEAELETLKPLTKNVNGEQVEYDDADYSSWVQNTTEGRYQQQAFGYKDARREGYGNIEEQLDMQYWDSVNDTTTWKDHIAQVKSDNPKPA